VFGSNSENSDLQIAARQKANWSWAQKKLFVQDRTRCKRTRDTWRTARALNFWLSTCHPFLPQFWTTGPSVLYVSKTKAFCSSATRDSAHVKAHMHTQTCVCNKSDSIQRVHF
jgi:hypothetical protein